MLLQGERAPSYVIPAVSLTPWGLDIQGQDFNYFGQRPATRVTLPGEPLTVFGALVGRMNASDNPWARPKYPFQNQFYGDELIVR